MMRLHVAFDQDGRIVGAAQAGPDGGDPPSEQPGLTVAEFEVPTDLEKAGMEQCLRSLVVDVKQKKLKQKSSSS
jgi:hypothetical protein